MSSVQFKRNVSLLGRDFVLQVRPLPQFFKPSDQYLPMLVGFGAAFISVLILLVLKASQNQLLYETRAKELSLLAMQHSRSQTELLQRLNESARELTGELDLGILTRSFFRLVTQLAAADQAVLYLASGSRGDAPLHFIESYGDSPGEEARSPHTISFADALRLVPNRWSRRKGESPALAEHFGILPNLESFADWLLIAVPARENRGFGLLLLARRESPPLEDVEIEIIESFVSQAAIALEKARLFRRVEEAARTKTAFLANMSHEIRTPLNVIIGFSEILLGENGDSAQKATLARNIRKGSQQLTRIIDDILDLSKIEAGELIIERKRSDVTELLRDVGAITDSRLGEKPIRFKIEAEGTFPEFVHTDDLRLKQILMTLLGNAVKFTERGQISLGVLYQPAGADDGFLVFRVRDTGVGISTEAQSRLFEPFSQADNSKTRRFGGSGIGLALARRLCQELGGDLRLIESKPLSGSTFEAVIATGDVSQERRTHEFLENVASEASPSAGDPKLGGAHILLVEDSVDNQEIFRFFLESAGADLEIVEDGLSAVRKAASGHFDLILMDIQIPELDGKEATRQIRHQGFEQPIIALTAHSLAEERASCLDAGCDGQITKPVSGDILVNEVAGYLRRKHGRLSQHFERDEAPLSGAPKN